MTKDSPEMETYSRLLSHLQESCKHKKAEVYEEFNVDISILISKDSDILRLIENDLKYILPSVLLYSVYKDVGVRNAAIKSFETFTNIVNKKPSIKNEPWYKDMESTLIAQEFSSHLIKLVEATDDTWPHVWSFVISLIVHDEQVHGVAINSLLKVVEIAFKLSRKFETVLEKAYYCWNRLIDIFSVHPRIVTSQKLIELLVRPLSTNLSLKCPKLKLETWSNLVHKVGFACVNTKCKLVIEPFIDFAYLKDSDSLCHLYPLDCIKAFRDIVNEKKLYRFCVTKIMSALIIVFESGRSDDLNDYIIEIWTALLDNIKEIEKSNVNDYITELINKIPQIMQMDRPGLSDAIIKVTLEKKLFCSENMKTLILAQVPIMPIISSFMSHCDFQKQFFLPIVDNLLEYFLEAQNKKSQSSVELEIWDLMCEVFILWLKSLPLPQEPFAVDGQLLCSLLLVPLLSKQWSVPVQKTWNSVLEYTQIIVPSNNYLSQFIEKFFKELSESHITAEFAVEFCTFLTNKDKSVFKSLMPTFNFISKSLSSKDPKPLMDLLVLIENSIKYVPKQDLMKLLTELMSNSNSYGQPYDLRIKTKITKLQRKLFTLKDPNENNKEQDCQQSKSQEKEQQNGQKTRSPLMAHSNFLHRLAKAEEKKVKKRASMSSIFGDIHQNDEVEAFSPEKKEEQKLTPKPSSQTQNQTPVDGKDNIGKNGIVNKEEAKEVEGTKLPLSETLVSEKDNKNDTYKEELKIKESEETKKLPLNGRSSPAIPSVVTVVTTPNRKRTAKVPEIVLSQEPKKPAPKATPPPPSYFEDEAMDYVIVPPKPKSMPLTEHQKEMMTKRRSDIPALYQDLSQDTQSMNSQSIKEIITLKEIKLNDTTKALDVISAKDDEINNTTIITDEENSKIEQAEKVLNENVVVDNKIVDDSQEIITDTQPTFDSGVNLSLTPTKHTAALPTQKNLLNKFNLLESDENGDSKKIDEEDEVEKENKIVNVEDANLQKITPIKRRSTRKSTNKYLNKKTGEETPKTKTKKEISESVPNTELIPKGKSKKTPDTAGKTFENTSSLKVKNSDSQECLKEFEKNENSDSNKNEVELVEYKDKADEYISKVITEDPKTSINRSEEVKTDVEDNVSNVQETVENTSEKNDNIPTDIVVPLNNVVVDGKLDKLSYKNGISDVQNGCTDISIAVVHAIPVSEVAMDVTEDSSVKENSESKSSTADASTPKETSRTSIKNDIPHETMDISKKECHTSSEKKEIISEEVLNSDVITESAPSLCESNSESENKLNEIKNVSSGAGDNDISTKEQLKDTSNNCETSTISNCFNDNNAMIVDECQIKSNENLNIIEENNMETEIKVEEQEDIDHNSSGDSNAASWSMVTPEKKSRKRRVTEVNGAEKFSPKLLRSKRLSLTKLTPDSSSEKNKRNSTGSKVNMKANKTSETDTTQGKKPNDDKKKAKRSSIGIIDNVNASAENKGSVKPNASDSMDSKNPLPDPEVSTERKASKRKNSDQVVTPPSQPKKAKTDSNTEEASQDSLSLLKNNSVKPRKKKIIKSNIKASPNNLEQWLIKSGKSVVKKTLLSSNDENDVQSESKILNNDSEIQISSSEPKKIIVEMSPVPKVTDNPSKTSDENDSEPPAEAEVTTKEELVVPEINVVHVEVADPVNLNLSEDKGIPSVLEPEMPVSSVVQTVDDIETIERQFLEAIKRRAREEEEENSQKSKEVHLTKPKPKRRSEEEDDDDEQLLTESLKCDETELERTSLELERNSNASRVKLESMIYAKYKTTLRRPRRRKRLLRRVKKGDDENELEEEVEEEEETFEERRERLVTPFRPSSGRSAQMVKMVTSEEDGPPVTPVRRRSITPLHLTENWPEGRCEQWVPCVPTPPGISPSLSILKRKVSPVSSPTSSPTNKKKRVSFLDPPVSKGLLYSKGSDNIGQVQHANIPPGKKPVWKGFEGEVEDKSCSDTSKTGEVVEGFTAVEAEDELTAIQEFLNSTPDAPWKDTPLAGDISKIPGILSCSDPVHNIISRLASPGNERLLSEELQRLKINTIGGFCSLTVSDIVKLSIRPAKVSTLYNVLKDYFQCQPSSSKKSQKVKLPEDSSKSLEDVEKMDFVETQIEITTLGIEMGVQVDPSEICSDDTFTLSQMSQKNMQNTQDLILTPPVVREPELYSDSQEDIKIPTREEIGLMFQSDVFIKRAAPFVTFNFLSKLTAAAAEFFGPRPD